MLMTIFYPACNFEKCTLGELHVINIFSTVKKWLIKVKIVSIYRRVFQPRHTAGVSQTVSKCAVKIIEKIKRSEKFRNK